MTYAILKNPAHTRVSYQDTNRLAMAELTALAGNFAENIRIDTIGGVSYVLFDSAQPLDEHTARTISRLSFVYAIFELFTQSGEMLKPIALSANLFIASELSTILKYTGKTNELFTRMMLNLAVQHVKNAPEVLNILDPLAGKGTTLYEALMQGHNAYGVEVDEKMAHESAVYLKKYLETARYKHENHAEKTSGQSEFGKFTAQRNQIKIVKNKGETAKQFEIIAGDTRSTGELFKKNMFHAIVADLPYGVQHSSKTGGKKPQNAGFTRNAMGLISEAMPGWVRVLKPGGAIVLGWNLFLIPKAEMAELLAKHGFAVVDMGLDFSHRVDKAIDRDIIVGVLK